MGLLCKHYQCIELANGIKDSERIPTRWGAESRCHELNQWNPGSRWTVIYIGFDYVPDYYEVAQKIRTQMRT